MENLPTIIAVGRALGATKVRTFSGPFEDRITGVQFKFGKYKLEDWEIHEKIVEFRAQLEDTRGVKLTPKPGGKINVEFSGEAYTRRSL